MQLNNPFIVPHSEEKKAALKQDTEIRRRETSLDGQLETARRESTRPLGNILPLPVDITLK